MKLIVCKIMQKVVLKTGVHSRIVSDKIHSQKAIKSFEKN